MCHNTGQSRSTPFSAHDAGECYLSDVPRPFKNELPGYRELEDRLLDLIYSRFLGSPLTREEEQAVREIDDGALYYDLKELIHSEQNGTDPQFTVLPDYSFRPFGEVEQEFMDMFRYYFERCREAAGEDGSAMPEDIPPLSGNGTASPGDTPVPLTRAPERPVPDYELLAAQLREFALTEPSLMPLLSNASALVKEAMADVNWAGFYLRRECGGDSAEPELLLGPFQGKMACIRIPWGRGVCGTAAKEDRSDMNVCFVMAPGYEDLQDEFLAFAKEHDMVGIKGHRSVGDFRASIYNACTVEDVQALVDCMQAFEKLKK